MCVFDWVMLTPGLIQKDLGTFGVVGVKKWSCGVDRLLQNALNLHRSNSITLWR